MHFSKASTYGIRSVAYIAAHDDKNTVSIRELSRQLEIPAAFLTKVMQRLASHGIVKTIRGYGGGVSLAMPASEISLKDIILAIDGEEAFESFWLGISKEYMDNIPGFHAKWKKLNDSIDAFFSNTMLPELYPRREKSRINNEESPVDIF